MKTLNKPTERLNNLKTLQSLRYKNYFLLTYLNPYFEPSIKVANPNDFESLLLTRLDAKNYRYADTMCFTPVLGCYDGKAEDSFMISFDSLTLAQKLELLDVFTEICKDLGQDSFIFRSNDNEQVLIKSATGQTIASGKDFRLLDNEATPDNYTLINGIKFSLNFSFASEQVA